MSNIHFIGVARHAAGSDAAKWTVISPQAPTVLNATFAPHVSGRAASQIEALFVQLCAESTGCAPGARESRLLSGSNPGRVYMQCDAELGVFVGTAASLTFSERLAWKTVEDAIARVRQDATMDEITSSKNSLKGLKDAFRDLIAANSQDKLSGAIAEVDDVKSVMGENLTTVMNNVQNMEALDEKVGDLESGAVQFMGKTNSAKRKVQMQKWMWWMIFAFIALLALCSIGGLIWSCKKD